MQMSSALPASRKSALVLLALCATWFGTSSTALAQTTASTSWIWSKPQAQEGETVYFRRRLELPAESKVTLEVAADDEFWLYFNGLFIGSQVGKQPLRWVRFDVTELVQAESNLIAIRARNLDGPAGLAARVRIHDGTSESITVSGPEWTWQQQVVSGWNEKRDQLPGWKPSVGLSKAGSLQPDSSAWTIRLHPDMFQPRRSLRLQYGDRVAWLGGTFVERAQRFGYLETALHRRNPGLQIDFRNLGWSGDTVWADSRGIFDSPAVGFQRMIDQVRELRPTLVILDYGGVESEAGKSGVAPFQQQLKRLITLFRRNGSNVLLLTPRRQLTITSGVPEKLVNSVHHYNQGIARRNANIDLYAEAIRQVAASDAVAWVELSDLLELTRKRAEFLCRNQPAADATAPVRPVSSNGIHLNQFGNWIAAEIVAARMHQVFRQNLPELWYVSLDLRNGQTSSHGADVSFEQTAGGLEIRVRDHLLPAPQCDDLSLLQSRLLIEGLPAGQYRLLSGDKLIGTASSETLAMKGIPVISPGPTRSDRLRAAVMKKNELYFHQWRPQNITYLLGFRRHEQGANSREIAQLRKLVAEQQEQIFELNQPQEAVFNLVPVEESQP